MATMNISLPDPLREFVEDQVKVGNYASASEFMRDLVRRAKNEHDLEKRLLDALGSEDLGELGPDFFEGLKARVTRLGKQGR
jgi:antitoxin ParD1/3/4